MTHIFRFHSALNLNFTSLGLYWSVLFTMIKFWNIYRWFDAYSYPILWLLLIMGATMLQAGRSRVRFPLRSLNVLFQFNKYFQLYFGPGVDPASNRNEYQESCWVVKRGRRLRLTTSPLSVSRLSGKMHDPRLLTTLLPSTACIGDSFTLFYQLWLHII
jgi:hypothetical protein